MSSILRQQPNMMPETISQDQRSAMFYDKVKEIKGLFNARVGFVHINQLDYRRYCFMMYVRDFVQTLDRSSQVIVYHLLSNIGMKATMAVTSLNEAKIKQSLRSIEKTAYELLDTFKYDTAQDRFWRAKALVDDLIYSYDKSDAQIVAYYGEEVEVIKIMRLVSKFIFNK